MLTFISLKDTKDIIRQVGCSEFFFGGGGAGKGTSFMENQKSCLPAWCHLESVPHLQEA